VSSSDASGTSATGTSATTTTSTSTASSSEGSTADEGIDAQTLANALQAMLMQFAQGAYSNVSDLTNATSQAAVTTA
jgi:hypothetical protein